MEEAETPCAQVSCCVRQADNERCYEIFVHATVRDADEAFFDLGGCQTFLRILGIPGNSSVFTGSVDPDYRLNETFYPQMEHR